MKTYWLIWKLTKETPNGYNQAVFKSMKELVEYLEEAYGPDYDQMQEFDLRTLQVASWDEVSKIIDLSHGPFRTMFGLR